jgi:serpin B
MSQAIVSMPKFTLEYELELNEALEALGMGIAFDPNAADFTRIHSDTWRLYISRVKHKTFVDVNEEGTEAAAATSVEVGVTSLPPMIAVDRPFLFVIREKFSGTILFMGVMNDPSVR